MYRLNMTDSLAHKEPKHCTKREKLLHKNSIKKPLILEGLLNGPYVYLLFFKNGFSTYLYDKNDNKTVVKKTNGKNIKYPIIPFVKS